ncbi:hypothetical protein TKK_0015353 [Trichogramma kaykai]
MQFFKCLGFSHIAASAGLSDFLHSAKDKDRCVVLRQRIEQKTNTINYGDSATHTLFKVGHVNAQSLNDPFHFREVRSIMEQHEPHIMAVSESWLKTHISSCDVDVPGYVLLRHDRISCGCGDVTLYVRNDLQGRGVARVYLLRPDFLFVLLDMGSTALLLGVVYRLAFEVMSRRLCSTSTCTTTA